MYKVGRFDELGKTIKYNSLNKHAVDGLTINILAWIKKCPLTLADFADRSPRSIKRMLRRAKSSQSPNQRFRPASPSYFIR